MNSSEDTQREVQKENKWVVDPSVNRGVDEWDSQVMDSVWWTHRPTSVIDCHTHTHTYGGMKSFWVWVFWKIFHWRHHQTQKNNGERLFTYITTASTDKTKVIINQNQNKTFKLVFHCISNDCRLLHKSSLPCFSFFFFVFRVDRVLPWTYPLGAGRCRGAFHPCTPQWRHKWGAHGGLLHTAGYESASFLPVLPPHWYEWFTRCWKSLYKAQWIRFKTLFSFTMKK